jgi:hypothetical protein
MVYRVRHKNSSDWLQAATTGPLVYSSSTDERYFLLHNIQTLIGGQLERMMIWGNPDLMNIMSSPGLHLFIDCTFKCVPRGFFQCLIIMVFDSRTDVYVPVFYALLQSKTYEAYDLALYLCIRATGFKMDASSVCCDFEAALLKAVTEQFKNSCTTCELVLCLFHWLEFFMM